MLTLFLYLPRCKTLLSLLARKYYPTEKAFPSGRYSITY